MLPHKSPLSPANLAEKKPPKKPPIARNKTVIGEISIAGTFPTVSIIAIMNTSKLEKRIPIPAPMEELAAIFFKKF